MITNELRHDHLESIGVNAILQKRYSPTLNTVQGWLGLTQNLENHVGRVDLICHVANNLPHTYLNKTGKSCHLVARCSREN